ncbi:carbohydrate sulfotransferase 11-like [Uranotaenia lowii]|uniref:carbohydrate sulfotransferase 11-like n=1 Tax=Uranotaenia lowii TaxID=190385 RepID=UPI00247AD547|nr:carbohydrate sulfotransferase 11-like [Uranotaenia lowii]XP_055591853.1 carbohydrate sulfotransferase 11-like [Uranotaenia lowii]XP_055591854.1 carbohydrate sulfotransferase 11-like [Uranotaenia lowii]XP_055591855.1 carbohydrate sulfotransferase 11-like [Uranotaenia lowii]
MSKENLAHQQRSHHQLQQLLQQQHHQQKQTRYQQHQQQQLQKLLQQHNSHHHHHNHQAAANSHPQQHRKRKPTMSLLSLKFNRRRFYICLKVVLLFVVFGLYFVLLLRESITMVSSANRNKLGPGGKADALHKAPAGIGNLPARPGKHNIPKHYHNNAAGLHPAKGGSSTRSQSSRAQNSGMLTATSSNHSTLNPVYEYSEELNTAAEADFNDRRTVLWNICAEHRIIGKYPPNAWEFFISPGHGLAWCNIFKAASSTWMYYFNILGGYDVRFLQRTRSSPIDLARQRFPRPSTAELNDYLSNTISFLIVREPFERLVSAYRNKLEGCRNKYYKLLGEQIIKKFRKKAKDGKSPVKYPKGPTFREFLQFLVSHYKSGGRFDEHWSPVYSFCTPCSINFTLIAKVETFQRDTEYIIRQAGLETLLLNKMPQGKARAIANRSTSNTRNLVPRYFSQIDEQLLTEVLEIYQLDFELFGYNSTKYYSYVQETLDDG